MASTNLARSFVGVRFRNPFKQHFNNLYWSMLYIMYMYINIYIQPLKNIWIFPTEAPSKLFPFTEDTPKKKIPLRSWTQNMSIFQVILHTFLDVKGSCWKFLGRLEAWDPTPKGWKNDVFLGRVGETLDPKKINWEHSQ